MFVKLDYELLPVLDLTGCAVKRNLEPFLPQHKKNFQYQTSGLFPDALLFLPTSYATAIPIEKRKDKPDIYNIYPTLMREH